MQVATREEVVKIVNAYETLRTHVGGRVITQAIGPKVYNCLSSYFGCRIESDQNSNGNTVEVVKTN